MEFQINNSHMTVTVSDLGAELRSICGADGVEYLWQGDPAYWADRSPVLFPYVGRLTQGCYQYGGVRYPMNIHGFAAGSRFLARQTQPDCVVLELTEQASTLAQYPFRFCFQVEHRLCERTLEITYRVTNRDGKDLYFGLGGHPGFRVPLAAGLRFEDYRLRFETPCNPRRVGMSADCFVTGDDTPFPLVQEQLLPLRHDLFDCDAIILKDMARAVTLEAPGAAHAVTVRFAQMPYLGIWHWPHTDAPYVCIEPWCALPSRSGIIEQLETQPDLLCLPPDQTYENRWSIQLGP